MPIYETFSKRQQKLASQGVPVLYQYDYLPTTFRRQVIHIWHGALGLYAAHTMHPHHDPWHAMWNDIEHTIARELGLFQLGKQSTYAYLQCEQFLLDAEINQALDLIELSFRVIDTKLREPRSDGFEHLRVTQSPDDAIDELNGRLREQGIGYQFAGGQIIRVDSQYLHNQVVEEALILLHEQGFQGPQDEFMRAHQHYRKGETEDAILDALRAFESTMKSICAARSWAYLPTANAKDLINVVLKQELIPSYLQTHFAGLRNTLEAGLPTVRNKTSGHGQGATTIVVPAYMAAYALHLAAANIVLLVQAHKALP
jgi:hypothetical protein